MSDLDPTSDTRDQRSITATLAEKLLAATPQVRLALELAIEGGEPSFDQGLSLALGSGADLEARIAVADAPRSKSVGDVITYVVNRNINFTNVCFVGCSFCGFGRGPNPHGAYRLSVEDVVRKARQAAEQGAHSPVREGSY